VQRSLSPESSGRQKERRDQDGGRGQCSALTSMIRHLLIGLHKGHWTSKKNLRHFTSKVLCQNSWKNKTKGNWLIQVYPVTSCQNGAVNTESCKRIVNYDCFPAANKFSVNFFKKAIVDIRLCPGLLLAPRKSVGVYVTVRQICAPR